MKPQNVLLSRGAKQDTVRALISDFGLCKRLQAGRNSLSRRSGVIGTDGWVAPEALMSDASIVSILPIVGFFHFLFKIPPKEIECSSVNV